MNEKNARKIKIWLLRQGLRQVDIARDMGLTPATIACVISGRGTSSRVVEYLTDLGCPPEYFAGRAEARRVA